MENKIYIPDKNLFPLNHSKYRKNFKLSGYEKDGLVKTRCTELNHINCGYCDGSGVQSVNLYFKGRKCNSDEVDLFFKHYGFDRS